MSSYLSDLIWSIAELLRGDYKQSDYGKVILPMTLLGRLDAVLEPTHKAVLNIFEKEQDLGKATLERHLTKASGQIFYNTSKHNIASILADSGNLKQNLLHYISSFSDNARDIFDRYRFSEQIENLDAKELLYMVLQRIDSVDLSPSAVSNHEMGLVFEELIRRFSELSNETAGEHFTPREVIRLMVELLFEEDDNILSKPGTVRTIYDPAAGTGGMLSVAEEHLLTMNPEAKLVVYGQELNDESYAICKAEMLIKGQMVENIICGNTLSDDGLPNEKFDYMLSNPPFGVEWKKVEKQVRDEHEKKGFTGRFGPGLPRVSDGSLLFLLHLLSKMRKPEAGGSRIGIVLNGSPLFTGGAGSGESEIRKWILENDLLEAIIALPTDMFYNTGIATYIWILSNRKDERRKGLVQLIDATAFYQKMKKSLGNKRKELSLAHMAGIVKLYGDFRTGSNCKIVKVEDLGYSTITVERPLKDENGNLVLDKKGKLTSDSSLRDTENVPLTENVQQYFEREVLPHVPDAWIDLNKTKKGYEIPFSSYFYVCNAPRSLEKIDAELREKAEKIASMLKEIAQ